MAGNMWTFLLWGLSPLVPALFVALRRMTAAKQEQLSPDEFRCLFQKAYLGMEVDQDTEAGHAAASSKAERMTTSSS